MKTYGKILVFILVTVLMLLVGCKSKNQTSSDLDNNSSQIINSNQNNESTESVNNSNSTEESSIVTDETQFATQPEQSTSSITKQTSDTDVTSTITQTPAQPEQDKPTEQTNEIGVVKSAEDFEINVSSVNVNSSSQYEVVLTLKYTGLKDHPFNAPSRFYILDDNKKRVSVDNIYDENGNTLMGSSISSGQIIKIRAVFKPEANFTAKIFRYVYAIDGFRYIDVKL